MANVPQLLEEDIGALNDILHGLIMKTEATATILIDKAGFVITSTGDCVHLDTMTLAALAAGSFAATSSLAELIGEKNFSTIYQQGDSAHLLVVNADASCLLTIVFKATVAVGVVKFYAEKCVAGIAAQLQIARDRAPGETVDLALLNIADTRQVFSKKAVDRAA